MQKANGTTVQELFTQYMECLRNMANMPPGAPDFIERYAENAMAFKMQLHQLGHEPVWESGKCILCRADGKLELNVGHLPEGTNVLQAYMDCLRTIGNLNSSQLDLIAVEAERAVGLKAIMHQSGKKPVYQYSYWEMTPLNQGPKRW